VWQEVIGTVGDIIDVSTDIIFRWLTSIKLGTVMSECDIAAVLLFSEQMTQHTNLTPHILQLFICCTALLALHNN